MPKVRATEKCAIDGFIVNAGIEFDYDGHVDGVVLQLVDPPAKKEDPVEGAKQQRRDSKKLDG
jgi:hypothetical protein